jgi:hypothetical protein
MSIRHGKLSVGAATEDFIRKMSSVSMEEAAGNASAATTQLGTDGTILVEEAAKIPESDSIPHINLGKNYQARVKKWADRAISAQERGERVRSGLRSGVDLKRIHPSSVYNNSSRTDESILLIFISN